jgi:hypothetical protein
MAQDRGLRLAEKSKFPRIPRKSKYTRGTASDGFKRLTYPHPDTTSATLAAHLVKTKQSCIARRHLCHFQSVSSPEKNTKKFNMACNILVPTSSLGEAYFD